MNCPHSIFFGKRILVLGAALMLALGASLKMRAQSTTNGAINGTVEDAQGGVVPGAGVSVVNEGTAEKLDATTNSVGAFIFEVLQPGVYTVTITAPNFATFVQSGVTVEVGRASTVTVQLKVASGTETVQVSGEPPQVNTTDQAIANNIGTVDLANLPTNGRRWSSFALLEPGVTPDPDGYQDLDFRGVGGYSNNNTVDGGDNNQFFFAEERGRTRIAYTISEDSITDFQVNTSDYSAQYGRSAGGVINTVTKSGTNQFHGDLFYYYKNNAIGAQDPFTTEPVLEGGVSANISIKPPFLRQQYGGSLGGPIWKNKLFFFFTYDGQDENFPIVSVPTSATFFDAITVAPPVNSMGTVVPCTAALESPTVTASATATQGAVLYCRGVTQAEVNSAMSFVSSFAGEAPRSGNQNIEFPKLDWHINPNNILTVSYNRMRWSSPDGIQTNAIADYGSDSLGNDYVHDDMGIARLSSTISPSITNEMLFSIGKDFEFEFAQAAAGGEPATGPGGLPPEILLEPSSSTVGNAPNSGTFILGTPSYLNRSAYPLEYREEGADTVSIVKGTHLIRLGLDVNHVTDTEKNLAYGEGAFIYDNTYPLADFITDYANYKNPGAASPGCVSSAGASIPCYYEYEQALGPLGFTFSTFDTGLFVQDTWKVTPRVTVNYGLRWDYEPLPKPQIPNEALSQTASFPNIKRDFGPRVGIAWDIFGDGKTSFRAGWGIYYGIISGGTIFDALSDTDLAGFAQSTDTFKVPFVAGGSEPTFPTTLTSLVPSSASLYFFDPNDHDPTIYETDASLQHQIGDHFVVSLSYMLSLGRDLPDEIDANLNQSNSENVSYMVSGGPFSGETFTEPVLYGARPYAAQGFGSFLNEFTDLGRSNYNAGVIEVTRHLSKGLELESSYTWSHALDNGQADSGFPSNAFLNQFDPGEDYGNSAFDVRNHFVVSAVWSPVAFDEGTWAHKILDGWTVAPIITLSSNFNYTSGITGSVTSLPGGLSTPASATSITGQSGSDRFPLLPRGFYTLPPVQNMNLHIGRQFRFGETKALEFDAECFNIFNKMIAATDSTSTNYKVSLNSLTTAPNYILTLANATTFGVPNAVSDTVYDVRQFQFVGKFSF